MKRIIIEEYGEDVFHFISDAVDLENPQHLVISTTTRFNIDSQEDNRFKAIVNLKKVNDIRRLNKFFESVNKKLPNNGIFICCSETYRQRNLRIIRKYKAFLGNLIIFFDFIYKRVFARLPISKKIYFAITKGRRRLLSKAEVLGRLVSCGFEIVKFEGINNMLYVLAKKVKEPTYDMNPSYGPIFKMKRIGKNGKIIYVYKFRTMHPYAEYLQSYILRVSGYSNNGKPAEDFRVTPWGKFLRKFWLDEAPQILNIIKGDMKLVGVRPISERFLKEYPEDIIKMRSKYKPGLFPPYVALLKQDVKEYIESERIYLLEKEKKPFTTDIKYFCKAVYNILTNKIRSA